MTGPAIEYVTVCTELAAEIGRITGYEPRLEFNADLGLHGVWLVVDEDGTEDIIGTGECESEALDAALKQIREWEAKS